MRWLFLKILCLAVFFGVVCLSGLWLRELFDDSESAFSTIREKYQKKIRPVLDLSSNFSKEEERIEKLLKDSSASGEALLPENSVVKAGVIPHHLVAGSMMNDFFQQLSSQAVGTVVVVGPNHFEAGSSNLISAPLEWKSAAGVLESDHELFAALVREQIVAQDDKVLAAEHSTALAVPFIRHYFSGAKFLPVIISSHTSQEELTRLADALYEYDKKQPILVIGSIDFSHYLTPEQAERNDAVTYDLIDSWDCGALLSKGNGFLDSPKTMCLVMELAKKFNVKNIRIFDHSNSAKMIGQPTLSCTSYFSFVYYR
jgi:AmmeMemoRadiSam system protein B